MLKPLGEPSNEVGRASTKGPLGEPVLRDRWASHVMQKPCKNHAKTMQNAVRTECQAAEPSQSPGSLLHVLYVLYGSHKANRRTSTLPRVLAIRAICAIWLLQGKPLNLHSPRVLYVLYGIEACVLYA